MKTIINGTSALAYLDNLENIPEIDSFNGIAYSLMSTGMMYYTPYNLYKIIRAINGITLPFNYDYNNLTGSFVWTCPTTEFVEFAETTKWEGTKTYSSYSLQMENITLKRQVSELEAQAYTLETTIDLLKLKVQENDGIALLWKGCTEAMKKTKSYVVPLIHIIMLLVATALLPLSIYSLCEYYFTKSSLINPYLSLALLFLSLGWGISVGILIFNMGVKKN